MSTPAASGEPIGLGRLCGPAAADAIVPAPSLPGLHRMEARLAGEAYAPHRHDCYAIGLTLHGVQSFRYRGRAWASLPGQVIVLHPDELHDGKAGSAAGLRYRMRNLEPALLRPALPRGCRTLPFVARPVIDNRALRQTLLAAFADLESDLDALWADQVIAVLADGLMRHGDAGGARRGRSIFRTFIGRATISPRTPCGRCPRVSSRR